MTYLFLIFAMVTGCAHTGSVDRISKHQAKPKKVVQKKSSLPKLLQEVEVKYKKAKTLEAFFKQTKFIASLEMNKESSGLIWVKQPGKFRWQINSPEPSVLVSNGKKFWFYTPPFDDGEKGQVIVKKSSAVQSEMASALLAGSFSKTKGLKVESKGKGHFVLRPGAGTSGDVKTAEIFIDTKSKVIQRVKLLHEGGNQSEITLSNIRLGKSLESKMFSFSIPPGTDVVDQL